MARVTDEQIHADIAAHCQRVADEAPPLTVDQRDRLALLLSGVERENPVEAPDLDGMGADVLAEMMGE